MEGFFGFPRQWTQRRLLLASVDQHRLVCEEEFVEHWRIVPRQRTIVCSLSRLGDWSAATGLAIVQDDRNRLDKDLVGVQVKQRSDRPRSCPSAKRVVGEMGDSINQALSGLAEGVGFEPTRDLRLCRFSRPVHLTALPPFRVFHCFALQSTGVAGIYRPCAPRLAMIRACFDVVIQAIETLIASE